MDYTKEEDAMLGRIADAAYAAGNPDGECTIHDALDVLSFGIIAEARKRDAAWTRLLRAEAACACSGEGVPSDATMAEYEAAKQDLRGLGVDVDSLLGGDR